MKTRFGAALAAVWLMAGAGTPCLAPRTASAATQVPAASGRLNVDVWTNKEEGGIYNSGEKMQIYFRANQDAYVLIYNIDTEGYVHLIYPFRPRDPVRVEGGETFRVPARHDPYDLVAEGPEGVEYVVAIASPLPFQDLPWFLAPGLAEEPRPSADEGDDLENGVIVGDPYVGMERLHRRLVPEGLEDRVASADTYFYIERRVEYPRYVCADCHHRTYWFDPYVNHCSVIEIRIDATWARYAPLRVRSARPRFYYNIRSAAPPQYRSWKGRWSSLDGPTTLRSKFVLERDQRTRQVAPRRQTPPEFKDLRRYRPGRFWQGRDEVIRLREQRERTKDEVKQRREEAKDRRDQTRERRKENIAPRSRPERDSGDRPKVDESKPRRERPEAQPKERKPEARERKKDDGDKGDAKSRDERKDEQERKARERRPEPPAKGRDRGRGWNAGR